MDEDVPPPPPASAAVAPRRALRALRIGLGALLSLIMLVVGLLAAVTWALRSESGSAWLVSMLPRVQVEGPKGRLLGDFEARRVVIELPGGATLTLAGMAWRGLSVERAAAPSLLRLSLGSLSIARLDVSAGPQPASAPISEPTDLRLPLEVRVDALHIGELHAGPSAAEPVRDLVAQLHLNAAAGSVHRVDDLAFAWGRLQARGRVQIGTATPLRLEASIELSQQAAGAVPPWDARATLIGPLAAPVLTGSLRAAPLPGRTAQALDARAVLRPFAAWPLGELQASTSGLDLSAFAASAPSTALTGRAVATTTAADQPARIEIALTNALAGRWNDGRLPVQAIAIELAARPDRPEEWTLQTFDAALGSAQAAAGRAHGTGIWRAGKWSLDAALEGVQPARLDARAPAMRLSGPLRLAGGDGAPIECQATLAGDGLERGAVRSVRLALDAAVQAQRLELRRFEALAGGARATLAGLATRTDAAAPWAVRARGELVDFDPAVWWPGPEDSPWRKARNRLNATATADLAVAESAFTAKAVADTIAALRGQATLALAPSHLAGVPVSGQALLRSDAGGQAQVTVDLTAQGNVLSAKGHLRPQGRGDDDAWDLKVDAGALDKLAPAAALFFQPSAAGATLSGSLSAAAQVRGRWPSLTTQGQLDATALRMGALSVERAQGHWSMGSSANAPVEARFDATRATYAGATAVPGLESIGLTLKGNGRAHQFTLRAESRARPPAWTEVAEGAPPSSGAADDAGTTAVLELQGGLVDASGAALSGWRGVLQRAEVRHGGAGDAGALLRAGGFGFEVGWGDRAAHAVVEPGRAELLGAALRWSRISWRAADAAGAGASVDADVELEPLSIAPLLARAQPDFGWSGDLRIDGHLRLHTSAAGFGADVVVERRGGDLSVTDELGTRALGLTDLRFGLNVADGVWNFTQGIAGTTLGVGAGAVVVRSRPSAIWPAPDAPMQGVLELRVAELGSWGNWVPPGWRLAGALHSSGSIAGRFGAPEFSGSIEGSQLGVRNVVEGVSIHDGDVAIRLQGASARIERFTAKAGEGSIRLTGSASLGEAPKAVLQLEADRFQLLGRVDRRIVVTGSGQLQIDPQRLAFDGRFGVDEGLVDFSRSDAPGLAPDVHVVRSTDPADARPSPGAAANPSRNVALDLYVSLGEKLRLRGRGLDTKLRGELHLTTPSGRLAVNGTVRAVDGTYAAYGQKLVIDRGLITFNGPIETPRLDIEATRPNLDVRVGVAVTGNTASPRIRLFSEPDMSELDKLSWLVMGRASEGLGRTDTALLQRAALALLAGEGEGPTDALTHSLGLDDLSVHQTDGEVRETVVSLGKQLSQRWYVGYEHSLNTTTGSFQLIYRIAQRFTLRAQTGADSSLDLIWTWRWQ